MGEKIVMLHKQVRLCDLSQIEIDALNRSIHEAILAVADEMGHFSFAYAVIGGSDKEVMKRAA